jgi:phenylalanine-4-hydroxylase
MCLEDDKKKTYWAVFLSSVGELDYCVSDKPKFLPLDSFNIAENHLDYPISSMQPIYFVADSFSRAKEQISNYCEHIS